MFMFPLKNLALYVLYILEYYHFRLFHGFGMLQDLEIVG